MLQDKMQRQNISLVSCDETFCTEESRSVSPGVRGIDTADDNACADDLPERELFVKEQSTRSNGYNRCNADKGRSAVDTDLCDGNI